MMMRRFFLDETASNLTPLPATRTDTATTD
jgi:hypothetical protein